MENINIYENIGKRTGGDIYIGVVGPVRAGKSTFIKRFMDLMVIPNVKNTYERQRILDEMPQSGTGKTITTKMCIRDRPTPFCILDEVEAALDDANIDRFINCLRKFTGIQFALVTHQKATMEHADVLYGVTMPEKGVSKVLSLSLGDNFEI